MTNSKEDTLYDGIKKFIEDERFAGSHNIHTPQILVHELIGHIPDLEEKESILVLFNLEFLVSLLYNNNINSEKLFYYSDHPFKTKFATKLGVTVITNLENIDMKFDVIIGNPPYQDGSKAGGQNKIYNQISKTALSLLKVNGIICFITPTSVLKKSKRFSLIGVQGLSVVNFNADDHFSEGVNICGWIVDKSYSGDVKVIHGDTVSYQSNKNPIYDYTDVDREFSNLYNTLKKLTDHPDKRMFKQNAVDTKTGRSKTQTSIYQYPVYKIEEHNKKQLVQFNKPIPKYHGKLKFIISMTKSMNNSIVIDTDDYDVAHLCTNIDNKEQYENIKSFILSEYFIQHSEKWKALDGYGYNYALKHLPPFDKNKFWTNNEVIEFFNKFITN
jgi:hypothetical protein